MDIYVVSVNGIAQSAYVAASQIREDYKINAGTLRAHLKGSGIYCKGNVSVKVIELIERKQGGKGKPFNSY